MAHNINTYIGRQAAWHRLGTVTGEYQTWQQILAHGGLEFGVDKRQLLAPSGRPVDAWGTFRKDNNEFLGVVGKDYTIIEHASGFEMVDALVASANGAHYETAGVLGDGQVVWGLADLAQSIKVGDDETKGYLLFATSYDGRFSHQYRTTMTRVVCQNTLTMAMSGKAAASFRIRHTKNANNRLVDAKNALTAISADFQTMEQKLNFLAGRRVTREGFTAIFDRLFPKSEASEGKEQTAAMKAGDTRRENLMRDILRVFESNDDNAFPEQRGTAYNLLNAITEHTDHIRSTRAGGNTAEAAMFGSGDRLKSSALAVIEEVAATLPAKEARAQHFVPGPATGPDIDELERIWRNS